MYDSLVGISTVMHGQDAHGSVKSQSYTCSAKPLFFISQAEIRFWQSSGHASTHISS